jgi:hypothetical protein
VTFFAHTIIYPVNTCKIKYFGGGGGLLIVLGALCCHTTKIISFTFPIFNFSSYIDFFAVVIIDA